MANLVSGKRMGYETFQKNARRRGRNFCLTVVSAIVSLSLYACAPALYHVDLKYVPTSEYPKLEKTKPDFLMTIALFNDVRQIDDTIRVGRVTTTGGSMVPVLPRYVKVTDAVTAGVREYLFKLGYNISKPSPVWDLKEETINKDWGELIIGGKINELEIVCESSIPVKAYRTKVQLTFIFADVQKKKIFYQTRVESSASLTDVFFSEKILTTQINTVFAEALEKIFDDPGVRKKIEGISKTSS